MKLQKRLAARASGCSPKRIKLDSARIADIKEAITTFDVRRLIKQGVILIKPVTRPSRGRIRHAQGQRRKGRRRGSGSRKGTRNARTPGKQAWMARIRLQRALLRELRGKSLITDRAYRKMYDKARGGFFRSQRHLKLYIQEQGLFQKK